MSTGEGWGAEAGAGAGDGAGVVAGGVTAERVGAAVREHREWNLPRLEVLWGYYRDEVSPWWWRSRAGGVRGVRGAGWAGGVGGERSVQERGLPSRMWASPRAREEGAGYGGGIGGARREVVIENDIAWRVQAMVDFLVGRPVRLVAVEAGGRAGEIEGALERVWEASGGMGLLQDAALLAHVYGSVDLVVRVVDAGALERGAALGGAAGLAEASRGLRVEIVEPRRGVGLVSASDYRRLDGCVLLGAPAGPRAEEGAAVVEVVEVVDAQGWSSVELAWGADGVIASRELSRRGNDVCPGRAPVVRVVNVSEPFSATGVGEVEPLLALQDELNTRLSDRACRVTLQSFKMYLAKGVDGFERGSVAPGTVWSTDNPEASVTAFGGDASSPSEESHISEVREAMDKVSGVPPLATGVVRARVGNLSSESALRLTLQGLLGKTARKRLTYGRALSELSGMILECLDLHGVLATSAAERAVVVRWPESIVGDAATQARAASEKAALGVPRAELLAELGYAGAERAVE